MLVEYGILLTGLDVPFLPLDNTKQYVQIMSIRLHIQDLVVIQKDSYGYHLTMELTGVKLLIVILMINFIKYLCQPMANNKS